MARQLLRRRRIEAPLQPEGEESKPQRIDYDCEMCREQYPEGKANTTAYGHDIIRGERHLAGRHPIVPAEYVPDVRGDSADPNEALMFAAWETIKYDRANAAWPYVAALIAALREAQAQLQEARLEGLRGASREPVK